MKKTLVQRAGGYLGMANDMRKIKRTNDDAVRSNAQRHLAQRMGKLRGLPQKIGQILSMSDDNDSADAFSDTRENAEPLPWSTMLPVLEKAWGCPVDSVLASIDTNAIAASLGQVYRATLHDGSDVAIKIAYPGIEQAVMNDLKMMGWLSAPLGDLRRGFDLSEYREEIVRDLHEELDYRTELRHQTRFHEFSRSLEGVVVPKPVNHLSTQNILVSSWETGQHADEVPGWSAGDRHDLARRLLRNFLVMLFEHGWLHADPHPGNYRFKLDPIAGPVTVLYDFGSVVHISPEDRSLLLRLILDTVAHKGDPMSTLVALGFNRSLLEPIQRKLPAVCTILFEPFTQIGKFDLAGWHKKERLDDVLGDDRWNFRMAGPAKLILLMRAFRGLLFYLDKIGEPVSWGRAMEPIIERHGHAARALEVDAVARGSSRFEDMASHLRIEVIREGRKKASLTMPVSAVEDPESLMGEEMVAKLRDRGVDLQAVVRRARQGGYAPTELFTLDESEKDQTVRVWIE